MIRYVKYYITKILQNISLHMDYKIQIWYNTSDRRESRLLKQITLTVIININEYNIFVISKHCNYQKIYAVKVHGGTEGT